MIDNLKSSRGITMITLTITIIIMLILAGIVMVEISGNTDLVVEVEKTKEEIQTQQNTTQNKITDIKEEWGTVLSQNKIENEVGSR